jgi:hypothetical protein
MTATMRHRVEVLKVVNDFGVFNIFRKVTPIVTEAHTDGTVSTYERHAAVTTLAGEPVNHISDGVFESSTGDRWRVAE